MLQPRFAEMHLGVDDAGQDVQAAGVEALGGGSGPAQVAERRNPAVPHADIGLDRPIGVNAVPPEITRSKELPFISSPVAAAAPLHSVPFHIPAAAALKDFPARLDNRCPIPERARRK